MTVGNGSPCGGGDLAAPIRRRFFEKVRVSSGCWEWTGCRDSRGYGRFYVRRGESSELTHRVSWRIHNGPISPEALVCHRCDNPPCVRPDHLFVGTQADNMKDAAQKERVGPTVLRPADVRGILDLGAIGMAQRKIADEFGVTQATVWHILRGKTWKHIERRAK